MILKLYEDGTIETLDTGKKINENDYMVNNLRVYADFLTEKQRLWVSYQYLKTPEGVDIKDENIYSKELLTINEKSNGYSSAIPPEVVSVPGMWGLQLFARTYSAINPNSYIEKKLSSDLYTISVYTGIPQVEDSENLSYAEVLTTLQSIENAHEKIDEINTRIDAIEAFPLEQGEAVGSLQQSIVEDGKTKGSTAHGKYSVALNKDNHAYQRSSFAVGGGNQVGMTEEEFNAKYPEGKDSVGSTYEESDSFAFVGGQQNKVPARGAAIPGGYLNVVDGDYSVVLTGHRNTVSARYASILGGTLNNIEVSSDASTILSGIYNIVGGTYCTVGGIFNVIRSSGTVALGNNLQSDGNHGNKKVLLGSFNDPNSWAFFQLGFGTEDDRKNLVEGFENGVLQYNVTADGSDPYQVANMGAVKEYGDKTYASKEYVKDTVTEALKNVNISGADGATFTPMVDAEGNLSWSNNKGYANPATVNIKGLKGDKGEKGDKGLQGATGADGKTPVKGVDYFTEADKLEIAQTVEENAKGDIVQSIIEELQGFPVFGVVDENNIIKVTSQLSDGTYILKYENEDGTLEVIGTITVGNGEVIEYTNLVDTTLTTDTTITLSSIGWLPNVRINSSNAVVTADGNHITNIIPVGNKNVLRIKNMDIYGGYGRIYLYNGTTFVHSIIPSNNADSFTALGDEYSEVTIAKLQAILSKNASDKTFDSVRIGGTLIGTKEDVIVTLDEEIT